MGEIMDVPATVEPFRPTPPRLNTPTIRQSTVKAVVNVQILITHHTSYWPKSFELHQEGPNTADIMWMPIMENWASVTSEKILDCK